MSTLKLSPLHHLVSLVAALFVTATLFYGAAANAQTRGPAYSAELAQPAAEARFVVDAQLWNCAGSQCTAGAATSRPAVVCARFVREAGAVTSFVANGRALEAADLERCNRSAN